MKDNKTVNVTEFPQCDFCEKAAIYDGKTKTGAWANMCESHFAQYGIGFGLGKGQQYVIKSGKDTVC